MSAVGTYSQSCLKGARALALYRSRAVANGLRTDHPIPGLPFADDAHIPVEDSAAIEAIGRRPAARPGAATTRPGPAATPGGSPHHRPRPA